LHLYEWEDRVVEGKKDVENAVSGMKLSYPGTDARWTDRLSPGIAEFAPLPDDQLDAAIKEYFKGFMEFAFTVLESKEDVFGSFPIFLRATAGMRTLTQQDRFRIMDSVRNLFSDKEFCPFQFEPEQARVISGEEEVRTV
jgi:Golgi nucleoside diphosphatase